MDAVTAADQLARSHDHHGSGMSARELLAGGGRGPGMRVG